MVSIRLTPQDHARIAEAVRLAEAGSDGEIVTIVAPASDRYNDVPLQYAVVAALLTLAVAASWPHLLLGLADRLVSGWDPVPTLRPALALLLILTALAFIAARLLLGAWRFRLAVTPSVVKTRRVRRRAQQYFQVAAKQRTRAATAVLLYLSLAERRAELVADAAIAAKVAPAVWGEAMAALIAAVRDGRPADGLVDSVGLIGAVLSEHFPRSADDTDELPNAVIEL